MPVLDCRGCTMPIQSGVNSCPVCYEPWTCGAEDVDKGVSAREAPFVRASKRWQRVSSTKCRCLQLL
jgi:hypothetical protein